MSLTPEQLELRRKGVFASDMSTIARLIPGNWAGYKTWGDLWDIKMGLAPDDSPSATVEWGSMCEPLIAEAWSKQTGRPVKRNTKSTIHPDIPFIGATVDYFTDDDAQDLVECKLASAFLRSKWNGQPPDYVRVQVLTQMAVHGKNRAFVAARVEGTKDRLINTYEVAFNPSEWSALLYLATEFWGFVQRRERPTT